MHLLLILVFCLTFNCLYANDIDKLQTNADVKTFVTNLDKAFKKKGESIITILSPDTLQKMLDCNGMAKKWNIKSWEKLDLNQDGQTDLLVTLRWYNFDVFAIMDKGDNTFNLLRLSKDVFEDCELAKPVKIGKEQAILFYSIKQDRGSKIFEYKERPQVDSLVYRYGNFVEYNPKPVSYQVKAIHFETSHCFGTCPVFKLDIKNTGDALYTAIEFNPEKGTFTGKIRPEKLKEIFSLMDYIHIASVKDNYQVSWTDDQTIKLKITFKDGTTKEISDYGRQGTFGLSQLYNLLFNLRTSETWYEKLY